MLGENVLRGFSLFQNGSDALSGGNLNAEFSGEAEHGASEEIAFVLAVGLLEITLERGFSFARKAASLEEGGFCSAGRQTDAGGLGQFDGFVDDGLHLGPKSVVIENLADGFVERGCDQAEGADEDKLFPNLHLNVRCPFALYTGAAEEAQNLVNGECWMERVRTEKYFARPAFLENNTRPFDVCANVDAGGQKDPVWDHAANARGDVDAIEQRQDDSVVADQGAQTR